MVVPGSNAHYCWVSLSKTVPHAAALAHHIVDKHTEGNHLSIKPDWVVNEGIYLENSKQDNHHNNETLTHCNICMWNFSSESNYQLHLEYLRPVSDDASSSNSCKALCIPLECGRCGRQFKQSRSLKQHFNVCAVGQSRN